MRTSRRTTSNSFGSSACDISSPAGGRQPSYDGVHDSHDASEFGSERPIPTSIAQNLRRASSGGLPGHAPQMTRSASAQLVLRRAHDRTASPFVAPHRAYSGPLPVRFTRSTPTRVANAHLSGSNIAAARLPSSRLARTTFARPQLPAAPTLPGIMLDDHVAAHLAQQHIRLLQTWWQATYEALATGVVLPQDIASQDFTTMQRVMGLAMVDTLQRQWYSGCGPCAKLGLPSLKLLPESTVRALQAVHRYVITRPAPERQVAVGRIVEAARRHIVAGHLGDDVLTRAHSDNHDMAETFAVTLFHAATAGALAARATQTALLGVFWRMLEAYGVATP